VESSVLLLAELHSTTESWLLVTAPITGSLRIHGVLIGEKKAMSESLIKLAKESAELTKMPHTQIPTDLEKNSERVTLYYDFLKSVSLNLNYFLSHLHVFSR
jgi:hypothetical protein